MIEMMIILMVPAPEQRNAGAILKIKNCSTKNLLLADCKQES